MGNLKIYLPPHLSLWRREYFVIFRTAHPTFSSENHARTYPSTTAPRHGRKICILYLYGALTHCKSRRFGLSYPCSFLPARVPANTTMYVFLGRYISFECAGVTLNNVQQLHDSCSREYIHRFENTCTIICRLIMMECLTIRGTTTTTAVHLIIKCPFRPPRFVCSRLNFPAAFPGQ